MQSQRFWCTSAAHPMLGSCNIVARQSVRIQCSLQQAVLASLWDHQVSVLYTMLIATPHLPLPIAIRSPSKVALLYCTTWKGFMPSTKCSVRLSEKTQESSGRVQMLPGPHLLSR